MEYLQYNKDSGLSVSAYQSSFKPYYKWNTFNTIKIVDYLYLHTKAVLNLIINGIPSIHKYNKYIEYNKEVLNLIINGIPSILNTAHCSSIGVYMF